MYLNCPLEPPGFQDIPCERTTESWRPESAKVMAAKWSGLHNCAINWSWEMSRTSSSRLLRILYEILFPRDFGQRQSVRMAFFVFYFFFCLLAIYSWIWKLVKRDFFFSKGILSGWPWPSQLEEEKKRREGRWENLEDKRYKGHHYYIIYS